MSKCAIWLEDILDSKPPAFPLNLFRHVLDVGEVKDVWLLMWFFLFLILPSLFVSSHGLWNHTSWVTVGNKGSLQMVDFRELFSYESRISSALLFRQEMTPNFVCGWWCEAKLMYRSMWVGFLYTLVTKLSGFLSNETPRNAVFFCCSLSIVNCMARCCELRWGEEGSWTETFCLEWSFLMLWELTNNSDMHDWT